MGRRYKEKNKKIIKPDKDSEGWTKSSIIFVISMFISAIAFAIVMNIGFSQKLSDSDGNYMSTNGTIISITPIKSGSQGRSGNSIFTSAYNVTYSYKIEDETFTKEAFLTRSKYGDLIKRISVGSKCRVFYNPEKGTSHLDKENYK